MRDIVLFCAVSLKDAIDDVNAKYQRATGQRVVTSYAGSDALAKQIEKGAPADIFISADVDWMDYLASRRLIKPETRFNLLGNKLALIARDDRDIALTIGPNFPLAKTLGGGRLAIANPASVPAGRYGKATLETLGVWDSLESRVAPQRDVRAVLAFVSRGKAPLGIVYQTDAMTDRGVKIIGIFPESSHPPISY